MRTSHLFKRLVLSAAVLMFICLSFTSLMAADTASLIVKMAGGLSEAEQAAVIAANGGVEVSTIPALRIHIIEVPAADMAAIIQNYQNDPRVVSVDENRTRKAEGLPSDTYYGNQWALPQIGWDLVFGTITPAGSATVAILDTGVDASHPELIGKIVQGVSILDGSDGLSDPNGHGTWMAGIVAANTDNGYGIAGVGFAGVNIMPITVLAADGTGQDSDIIAGIIHAVDSGADVILMGFSNPGFSQNLQDAIDYAWSRDVILVASAGNDALGNPTFPAGDRGVIGVSATDSTDTLAGFSNYGQDVFLAAPGVSVGTTDSVVPFVSISGTSPSAAIIAGAAALMRANDTTLTNGVIVGRLARTADPAGTLEQTGNGRVNMARAFADTSIEAIQPAGADPVGDGGPYVGPYVVAARNFTVTFAGNGGGSVSVNVNTGILSYGTSGSGTNNCSSVASGNGTATVTLTGTCTSLQTSANTVTVTLSATPNVSSSFGGWGSGGGAFSSCSGTGTCSGSSWGGSTAVTATFNAKLDQTITFGALSNKTYGDPDFSISASASSGLPVTFTASGSCSVSDSTVHITGAGSCTITAHQAGSSSYNAAPDVDQSFTINPAPVTIKAGSYSGTYDGAAHDPSACTVSGTYKGALTCTNNPASVGPNVGSGTVAPVLVLNGEAATNFTVTPENGSWSIIRANAICTVTGYSVIYDGLSHTATGSCIGVKGETLAGLNLSGTTHTTVGKYTDTWTFTDVTGNYNDTSGTVNDNILAWTLKGFYQPVDMNGVLNTVKNGSTVPLKFEIFAGATELTDVSAVKSLSNKQVPCSLLEGAAQDAIEEIAATGGTVLRYDATGGQFIFNLKTPNKPTYCYQVVMTTQDGSFITAFFKLK